MKNTEFDVFFAIGEFLCFNEDEIFEAWNSEDDGTEDMIRNETFGQDEVYELLCDLDIEEDVVDALTDTLVKTHYKFADIVNMAETNTYSQSCESCGDTVWIVEGYEDDGYHVIDGKINGVSVYGDFCSDCYCRVREILGI